MTKEISALMVAVSLLILSCSSETPQETTEKYAIQCAGIIRQVQHEVIPHFISVFHASVRDIETDPKVTAENLTEYGRERREASDTAREELAEYDQTLRQTRAAYEKFARLDSPSTAIAPFRDAFAEYLTFMNTEYGSEVRTQMNSLKAYLDTGTAKVKNRDAQREESNRFQYLITEKKHLREIATSQWYTIPQQERSLLHSTGCNFGDEFPEKNED